MIVIIEDCEQFVTVLRLLLAPVKVLVAPDMATAETLVGQAGPQDTILVDLSLPDSAPIRTINQIADWKLRAKAPRFIVMTGIYDRQVLAKAELVAGEIVCKHDKRGLFNVLQEMGVIPARGRPGSKDPIDRIEYTVAELVG